MKDRQIYHEVHLYGVSV